MRRFQCSFDYSLRFFFLSRKGWEGNSQTILLARRGRTIRMCSLDARSEGQSGCSPQGKKVGKIGRLSPGLLARPGTSIAKQSEGMESGDVTRRGRPSRPTRYGKYWIVAEGIEDTVLRCVQRRIAWRFPILG